MSNRTDGQKIKIVADNRKASFLYEIIEKYEAGISLFRSYKINCNNDKKQAEKTGIF